MEILYGQTNEWEFYPNGFDIITSGSSNSGNWFSVIPATGSVVFSAGTVCSNGSGSISAATISNQLFGKFTNICVANGTLIAYKLT